MERGGKMKRAIRIRLFPTKEQEEKMFMFSNSARFMYNWTKEQEDLAFKRDKSFLKYNELSSMVTKLKEENLWLNEVSRKTLMEGVKDCCFAYEMFFKGISRHPKFKSKKGSKASFATRGDRLIPKNGTINLEKIGRVVYKGREIPKNIIYFNPRVVFDGKFWYIGIVIETSENQTLLNSNLSIGVDIGIKTYASCSDGTTYKGVCRSRRVVLLETRLKRLRRKYSKKMLKNNIESTKNSKKLKEKITLLERRINNIKKDFIHKTTSEIINKKPYRIVLEDLQYNKMSKVKIIQKQISNQNFSEFKRQMEYKCEDKGISLVFANRWYPSSKLCSCCYNIKKDLKLSDRTYICEVCGLVIDRDLNASINLANYK